MSPRDERLTLRDDERLLLRAALGDGDEALRSFRRWRAAVDLDTTEGPGLLLIPLLYRNLERLEVPRAETRRYANAYRHTWTLNQLALEAAAGVASALEAEAIASLWTGDVALALGHYGDAGVRRLGPLEVTVPWSRADAARTILAARGWVAGQRAAADGVTLLSDGQRQLLLRSWVCDDARWPGADAGLWATAAPLLLGGATTRMLAPTAVLYRVLSQAARSDAVALCWAADAAVVARGGVDWQALVHLATRRRTVPALLAQLTWLGDVGAVAVPSDVLTTLAQVPISAVDRREYADRASPRPYVLPKVMRRLWTEHRRGSALRGAALVRDFAPFLGRYYRGRLAMALRKTTGKAGSA